ncbi:hypothetical protein Tco_0367980 [Tanacetum coccineum]
MNGSIEESCGQALRWHRRDLWADDEARMIGGVGGKKLQKNGGALMRLSLYFNKKFYNYLGSAPNHYSVV